jgi:hypothetical protein
MEAMVFYALFSILFALFAIYDMVEDAPDLLIAEEGIEKIYIKLGIFSTHVSVDYLG